jgi:ABC-type multidrug transport system fused ATPase/permease subunit
LFFAPTINDNIAHGKDGSPIEEIRAAVELANAVILLVHCLGF